MVALGVSYPVKGADTPDFPEPLNSALPLVGSDATGHTFPGATVPFGMVQLSPDTRVTGWESCAGYFYGDKTILGFSHTHLAGTGIADMGDVLLMPTVGDPSFNPYKSHPGYASGFSHEKEFSRPGYYKVLLQDPQVTAELTATAHAGFHRYTFPESTQSHVVIDLISGLGQNRHQNDIAVEDNHTISGHRLVNGWAHNRDIYFVAQFSKPFEAYQIEADGKLLPDGTKAGKGNIRALVNFSTKANEQILIKVGISGTSVEAARNNLSTEISDWNFDRVLAAAQSQWKDVLSTVEIETPDRDLRETFYSNLYCSMLAPTLYNDADGGYRGMDGKNHPGAGFQNYTTFSIWDIYRAEMPLLLLLQPNREKDFVQSLLTEYVELNQHQMPVWPLWGTETECMIGFHSAPIVASAYLRGFRDFDANAALAALEDTAENPRDYLGEFNQAGYIPSTGMENPPHRERKESVSRTLEYAYDNWCVGQLALALGKKDEAVKYLQRAQNYKNVFDASVGFMRGKSKDGKWREPFVPNDINGDYTEADAWQYTFCVQQDVPGLIKLMGGDQAFVDKLDQLFTADSKTLHPIPDITGMIGQYAHGDEPVHHVAYLYDYAGAPYKTQQYVRKIMNDLYTNRPNGQCGNIDCGQMTAWYVLSAMGFYPVNPASGVYLIGSPTLDKATIHLDSKYFKGTTFTIEALNNSPENIYIQSAKLNGTPLDRCWISHAELTHGGTLQLQMGAQPNPKWGADASNRPPVMMKDE